MAFIKKRALLFVKTTFFKTIISLMILFSISCLLHEVGHYLCSTLVYHIDGYITLGYVFEFHPSTETGFLVNYAGGVFAALVTLPFLFIKLPHYIKWSLYWTLVIQLMTAVAEGIKPYYYHQTNWYITLLGLSIIIPSAILLYKDIKIIIQEG